MTTYHGLIYGYIDMPNIIVPINETYEPISRRVDSSVLHEVMRITGIDNMTNVELLGELDVAKQPGATVGDTSKIPMTMHTGRVLVTSRETYRESEVINAAVRHADAQPFFQDPALGIHIKPIYSATDVELNFTYRAPTKQLAERWRDDIKLRLADDRQQHLHKLEYHYPVPPFINLFLVHVHSLREKQGGYGQSLGNYLRQFYTDRATIVNAVDGDVDKGIMVVAETQIGVQGWFDFIEPAEAEKNAEGPSWNVQFIYRFNYKKPISTNMQYGLTVHNQVIDPKFIPVPLDPVDPDKVPHYGGQYRFALETFDYAARVAPRLMGGVAIPDYDDWIPDAVPKYTTTLLSWMTLVEPKDLGLIMGVEDFYSTGLHPSVLKYMREQGNKLLRKGHASLHFCLYREREYIIDGDLELVPDRDFFQLRALTIPDVRRPYHLRMSFCTDIAQYTKEALEEMHVHGYATLRIFQTVVPRLDVEDAEKNFMIEGRLDRSYIKRFFAMLRGWRQGERGDDDAYNNDNTSFDGALDTPYVQYLTIIAGNKN